MLDDPADGGTPVVNADASEIERIVSRAAIEYGRRVRRSAVWLYVDVPEIELPEHGWKLHISARAGEFERIAHRVVPVLLSAGCPFKMARSPQVLRTLNDGRNASAAVGKAWTVYPAADEIRELGTELAELLRGEHAPRILSDRRVGADAPVYYRYGPFRRRLVAESDGQLISQMHGPNGESFSGRAELGYRQPPWTVDPFTGADPDGTAKPGTLLGGRYRPTDGLHRTGHGNVYRATDIRTGAEVIVKQARAYVAESEAGYDARVRLRNERYVLERLADISGVPRFIDHFRHDADEYLVTSFDGDFNLAQDIPRNGRFRPLSATAHPASGRTLDRLATRLARILGEIHARGFVVGDLSPKNVVIGRDDEPVVIDFGLCNHDGVRLCGGTPGYATHAQLRGVPPTFGDDLYALGLTLLFAATGADPLVDGADPDAARHCALRTIARIYGDNPVPSIRCVAGLLHPDAERARAALRALGSGRPERFTDLVATPAITECDRSGLARLTDTVLNDLVARTDELLAQPEDWADANIYHGAAGVALELRHHLDRPGVARLVRRLAISAAESVERTGLRPGLFVGSTGIEILLRRLCDDGMDIPTLPMDSVMPGSEWEPYGDDVIAGAAGVGLGHCLLAESNSTPPNERDRHLEIARRCANLLLEHADAVSHFAVRDVAPNAGLDAATGLAHGQAGVITALLRMSDLGLVDRRRLAVRIDAFYRETRSLITRSGEATAVPLCVSWCRGLAGIGLTLLRLAAAREDPRALDLARAAGEVCADWIPYLSYPSACCGIAGVGDFLVHLADATGDARFTDAAWSAATQLVIRGVCDTPARGDGPTASAISWARGSAGILAFLRHLGTPSAVSVIEPF
ncbi:lanthionine synthetase LanC family protein [Nocardia arthritidis]|nr:lanthionine synthetase LanC family protein [Nocardia arthritidis]